jgi:NAD(P)-dependent dehydrogenase (short-subunit alcohol dehydrogenase family)
MAAGNRQRKTFQLEGQQPRRTAVPARFENRVALVTGAAGAIGTAAATALAREGARLALIDQAPLDAVVQGCDNAAEKPLALALDVREGEKVKTSVAAAMQRFGRIDILVNAAGVVSQGPAEAITEAEWQRVLDINLKGTFLFCQAAMPLMRRQRYGRIINLGSVIGKNGGNPRPWLDRREMDGSSNVAYGVSKAGVHALTLFLAKDLAADGVTVNAVAPGPIATGMTANLPESLKRLLPVGRLGTPAEVAEAILASEGAGFITGEILDVNGGLFMD